MIDTHSATWQTVKAWAEQQLKADTADIEAEGTSSHRTEFLRGRLRALRALLKLTDPPPARIPAPASSDT
ncbi:MAG: hypothetical protein Q7S17_07725 [Xanthobacteraceae bacterium]|nr:hypothetical protein [Xanthobacteraceae bacterium]